MATIGIASVYLIQFSAIINLKFIMESKDQEGSHLIVIIQYTNVEIQCGLCEEEVTLLGILTRCEEI